MSFQGSSPAPSGSPAGNMAGNPTSTNSQSDSGFGGQGTNPMMGGPNPFDAIRQRGQTPQQQNGGNPSGLDNNPTPPRPEPRQESVIPQRQASESGASPLDKYMRKPDNSSNTEGQPAKPANSPAEPKQTPMDPFSFNNEQYGKLLENQDFVGEISPDAMVAIQQGDSKALADIINKAVRGSGAMAAHYSTQIAQRGVKQGFDNFRDNDLQSAIKNNSYQQEFQNSEGADILRHPAVEPMAQSKMAEFRQQYPDASPREITEATRKYFEDFAGAFTNSGNQNNQPSEPKKRGLGHFFNS